MSAPSFTVGAGNTRQLTRRLLIVIGLTGVAGVVVWGGMKLVHGPTGPRRQVAKIMVLPDTPPPPAPPPDTSKPPPKEMAHQEVNVPKPQAPQEVAQLKMEGQAGDGPSPFAAGDVKQDYIGGDIGNGSRYSAYVGRLEQRIQSQLAKRKLRLTNVKLFVWLTPDGSIQRYTVQGGDSATETQLREAMADVSHEAEPPLPDMPMPVGLTVN